MVEWNVNVKDYFIVTKEILKSVFYIILALRVVQIIFYYIIKLVIYSMTNLLNKENLRKHLQYLFGLVIRDSIVTTKIVIGLLIFQLRGILAL